MDLVLKAFEFAKKKHEGQKRKVTGADYIIHPFTVAILVAMFKKSKNLDIILAAAYLHDTVEDTDTSYEELVAEFGMFVATLVFELTDDKVEAKKIGKVEYQQKRWVAMSSYALCIKLCDRLMNMSDNPTDTAVRQTIDILDHLEKKRKLTKTHKAIVVKIREKIRDIAIAYVP